MKKKVIIISLILIVFVSFSINAFERITKEFALENYKEKTEIFKVDENQFKSELEKREPGVVMFATSVYWHYDGVTIDDVYRLYDEIGDCKGVVSYLIEQENKKIIAADIERVNNEYEPEDPEKISKEGLNSTKYETAIAEYEKYPERFMVSSKEELIKMLDESERTPGEVLFATSLSKALHYPTNEIYKLIDENDGDYEIVYEIVKKYFNENQ